MVDTMDQESNRFPSNMEKRETDKIISLINSCKEVCDTEIPIGFNRTGKLTRAVLTKENGIIKFNGKLEYGDKNYSDFRLVTGTIYMENTSVVVEMNIVKSGKEPLNLNTKDVFTKINGKWDRQSTIEERKEEKEWVKLLK